MGTIFSIIVIKFFHINCLFKELFQIPCPGCGLTRAFRALFDLDFKLALYYNYLIYPILIVWLYCTFLIYKDFRYKENNLINFYNNIFVKNYKLIILMLIVSEILNLIHKI